MNTLEDKLRAALEETAGEIRLHSVPPLRLDRRRRLRLLPAGGQRWRGWLTPLATEPATMAATDAAAAPASWTARCISSCSGSAQAASRG